MLRLVELVEPGCGPGEVLVDVTLAGVNFADTHQRRNEYLAASELPLVPGAEVAGVRRDTGERVVALTGGRGGYAEVAAVPAEHAFAIPDGVDDATALALLLQGLTAWHLLRTSGRVAPGESVVVARGGRRDRLARGPARAPADRRRAGDRDGIHRREARARAASSAPTRRSTPRRRADRAARRGERAARLVDVVLDAIGGEVFDASLEALAPFGRLVTYGVSGGKTNTVNTRKLMRASRTVTGFWFRHCLEQPAELLDAPVADLFARAAARGAARRGRRDLSAGRRRAGADRPRRAAHDRQAAARRAGLSGRAPAQSPAGRALLCSA